MVDLVTQCSTVHSGCSGAFTHSCRAWRLRGTVEHPVQGVDVVMDGRGRAKEAT